MLGNCITCHIEKGGPRTIFSRHCIFQVGNANTPASIYNLPLTRRTSLGSSTDIEILALRDIEPTSSFVSPHHNGDSQFSFHFKSQQIFVVSREPNDVSVEVLDYEGHSLRSFKLDPDRHNLEKLEQVQTSADQAQLAIINANIERIQSRTRVYWISSKVRYRWIASSQILFHPNDSLVLWCNEGFPARSRPKMKVQTQPPFIVSTPDGHNIGMDNYGTSEDMIIQARHTWARLPLNLTENVEVKVEHMNVISGGKNGRLLVSYKRLLCEPEKWSAPDAETRELHLMDIDTKKLTTPTELYRFVGRYYEKPALVAAAYFRCMIAILTRRPDNMTRGGIIYLLSETFDVITQLEQGLEDWSGTGKFMFSEDETCLLLQTDTEDNMVFRQWTLQ